MIKVSVITKKKLIYMFFAVELVFGFLALRVLFIQLFEASRLLPMVYEQQTRDRLIPPDRGQILDRNGTALATTESVCSVSVIRAQMTDIEGAARILADRLDLDYEWVLAKCKKRVALERIKTKVEKSLADEIRSLNLDGVIIDEDIHRIYPFQSLAAQVIGFVGRDNQGVVGLEAKYDEYLKGSAGKILTETDGGGQLLPDSDITRIPPVNGDSLVTTLDLTIQEYAEQTISKAVEMKKAERGLIVVMNPQNGEIYAIANSPTFDLNDPFTINDDALAAVWDDYSNDEKMRLLNGMWRNFAISDTYEPGSTFKIVTSAAGLEEGVVTLKSTFNCSGGVTVANRYIKCWRSPRSHGFETFAEGVQNSCNPVFMKIAEDLGVETFYKYLNLFELNKKTGVDLPGEAVGIFHKLANAGPVELATMSFGQSFQITPLALLRAVSASINGGYLITPHVGDKIVDEYGAVVLDLSKEKGEKILSDETSAIMREVLESVVAVGTGNRTYIEGYKIGGKTATSEKLPRRSGKYIASFIAFAPADDPQVVVLTLIDEPQGTYYGGQVAGPVMKELLENILPVLEQRGTIVKATEKRGFHAVSTIIFPTKKLWEK